MALIKVETDEIQVLAEEGGKLVMSPAADVALYQLFRLKALVDDALEQAARTIEEQGLEINPAFTSVQADHVKALYRAYGSKYDYEWTIPEVNYLKRKGMLERKVSYSLNSKEVDKYLKENGRLPKGIVERERTKKMTLSPIQVGDVPEVIEGETSGRE